MHQGTEEEPRPRVTLANGEVIAADILVGADGCKSLVREIVLEEEDCAEPGGMTLYTGVVDAEDMSDDPDLAPFIQSDEVNPYRLLAGGPCELNDTTVGNRHGAWS